MREFLDTFDVGGVVDGKVTKDEFLNYYHNVSCSIDDDDYFELMIRNARHIAGGEGCRSRRSRTTSGCRCPDAYEVLKRLRAQGVDAVSVTSAAGATFGEGERPRARPATRRMSGSAAPAAAPRPATAEFALDCLRKALKARGVTGIVTLARNFRIADRDRSGVDLSEFGGVKNSQCHLPRQEDYATLFAYLDDDGSGDVDYEVPRPPPGPMSQRRKDRSRSRSSTDGSGVIECQDVVDKFDASQHPDVKQGKKSPDEVLREFLDTFGVGGVVDGKVARFGHYYHNVSCSIDDDDYFELVIRNAWHIPGGEGWCANTANLRVLVTHADGSQSVEMVEDDLGLSLPEDALEVLKRLRAQGVDAVAVTSAAGQTFTDDGAKQASWAKKCSGRTAPLSCRPPSAAPATTLGAAKSGGPGPPGDDGPRRRPRDGRPAARGRRRSGAQVSRWRPRAPGPAGRARGDRASSTRCGATSRTVGSHGLHRLRRSFLAVDGNGTASSKLGGEFVEALRRVNFSCTRRRGAGLHLLRRGPVRGARLRGVRGLRPGPLSDRRARLRLAFDTLDVENAGAVSPGALAERFDAQAHPDVLAGLATPEDAYATFMDNFDVGDAGRLVRLADFGALREPGRLRNFRDALRRPRRRRLARVAVRGRRRAPAARTATAAARVRVTLANGHQKTHDLVDDGTLRDASGALDEREAVRRLQLVGVARPSTSSTARRAVGREGAGPEGGLGGSAAATAPAPARGGARSLAAVERGLASPDYAAARAPAPRPRRRRRRTFAPRPKSALDRIADAKLKTTLADNVAPMGPTPAPQASASGAAGAGVQLVREARRGGAAQARAPGFVALKRHLAAAADPGGYLTLAAFKSAIRGARPCRARIWWRSRSSGSADGDGRVPPEARGDLRRVAAPGGARGPRVGPARLRRLPGVLRREGVRVRRALAGSDEFFDYHRCVSAAVGDDAYFKLLVRNVWRLEGVQSDEAMRDGEAFLTGAANVAAAAELISRKFEDRPRGRKMIGGAASRDGRRRFTGQVDAAAEAAPAPGQPVVDVLKKGLDPGVKAIASRLHQDFVLCGGAARGAEAAPEGQGRGRRRRARGHRGALYDLRTQLAAHGARGIVGLARKFRIVDDDGSKSINSLEFHKALKELGMASLTDSEQRLLFDHFDRDGSRSIDYEEFLRAVRPPMNGRTWRAARRDLHPDVLAKSSAEDVYREFLETFDVGGDLDGKVTAQEFENYYENVSCSVDDDDYFELMMRNAWHIPGGDGWCGNTVECVEDDLGLSLRDEGDSPAPAGQGVDAVAIEGSGGAKVLGPKSASPKTFRGVVASRGRRRRAADGPHAAVEREEDAGGPRGMFGSQINIGETDAPPSPPAARSGRRTTSSTACSADMQEKPAPAYGPGASSPRAADGSLSRTLKKFDGQAVLKSVRAKLRFLGCRGIAGIAQVQDRRRRQLGGISPVEFHKCMAETGLRLATDDVDALFALFDGDANGAISYDEFLLAVARPMASRRVGLVDKAFGVLDRDKSGVVDVEDLVDAFDTSQHPRSARGEFHNYYANVSASVDDDDYFELMIRNAWHIPGGEGWRKPLADRAAQDRSVVADGAP
ncbi:serine/threonine kinase [Aureococcus anophagefferens]|nr:serine/threonine kinase [Aureococcus anophagefferens]